MWPGWLFVAGALGLASGAASGYWRPPVHFAVISAPEERNIYYQMLPTYDELLKVDHDKLHLLRNASVLIDGVKTRCLGTTCDENSGMGLGKPQGLALHTDNRMAWTLYVSDVEAMAIYAYGITQGDGVLTSRNALFAGTQRRILKDIPGDAPSIAVDGEGNLFLSQATSGQILSISKDSLDRMKPGATLTPKKLYSKEDCAFISSPGGIAVDNFYLFWVNQESGSQAGSLIQAHEVPRGKAGTVASNGYPKALSKNLDIASGVCVARNLVFYTDPSKGLYAVYKDRLTAAEVTDAFVEPRGCAYDTESTLYVADRARNGIYSLPANLRRLRAVNHLHKVVDVPAPNQVVIIVTAGAAHLSPGPAALLALLAAAALGARSS